MANGFRQSESKIHIMISYHFWKLVVFILDHQHYGNVSSCRNIDCVLYCLLTSRCPTTNVNITTI